MAEVTNRDLYDAINGLRTEMSGSISRLDNKFSSLETGRLADTESRINRLEIRDATLNTKVYVLVFVISTVMSAAITVAVTNFLGR